MLRKKNGIQCLFLSFGIRYETGCTDKAQAYLIGEVEFRIITAKKKWRDVEKRGAMEQNVRDVPPPYQDGYTEGKAKGHHIHPLLPQGTGFMGQDHTFVGHIDSPPFTAL